MEVCTTYATEAAARKAVAALSRAGVPDQDIWLLTGSRPHDLRREPEGAFAGAIGPFALVGTYGNSAHVRRQAAGGFAGEPDRQRQGSFADSDRMVITTARDDAQRSRVAGYREVRRLLRGTEFDHDVQRLIDELAMGRTAVVAGGEGVRPEGGSSAVEPPARAA